MISYSQQYFGKELSKLEYFDIEKYFINEKEESDKIEFKGYHKKYGNLNGNLKGVIRGICAFLNSNGGILIWGAPIGIKEGKREIFKGNLSLVDQLIEKDSLISKVSDSITPLPVNINVQIIEKNNLFLYIFEVQISNYSPHQFNNTYWARLDGQTKPAPHYLINALFNKISYPNIEGYITLDEFGNYNDKISYLLISIWIFNFSELENEYDITYKVIVGPAIFEGSKKPNSAKFYGMKGHRFNNNGIKTLYFGEPHIKSQKLIFDINEIGIDNDSEISIVLSFGGKKSPLKTSSYKLKLSNSIPKKNPNELIYQKEENVLLVDRQKKLGVNKENLLKELLRR